MKMALSKSDHVASGHPNASMVVPPGSGYVTEKLYMLLQLYLQNKGWNPSVELLQCFSELKDSPLLPSPAYLQVIANRVTLDSQGRLILRDSGKIVLPYEHFGNAVMLKHMQGGPHGIHLSAEATLRAVMESYTMGRENFGMEKEFVVEVVKSCPNCRYYQNYPTATSAHPDYMVHLQQMAAAGIDISSLDSKQKLVAAAAAQQRVDPQQAQITAAIIHQQNRAMAQQSLDKNFVSMEKQRLLQAQQQQQQQQQQQHKHFETHAMPAAVQPPPPPATPTAQSHYSNAAVSGSPTPVVAAAAAAVQMQEKTNKINEFYRSSLESLSESISSSNKDLLALHNGAWPQPPPPPPAQPAVVTGGGSSSSAAAAAAAAAALEARSDGMLVGQEKIVRAFSELMRNMARMKQFIRPTMCKPYGKQSESLQKTLMDTIQIVQTLRSYLPAPHIPVSSWKSESHRKEPEMGST